MTAKAEIAKEKNRQIGLENFKDKINWVKSQPIGWGKMSTNHLSDKRLSKIYRELKLNSIKNQKTTL